MTDDEEQSMMGKSYQDAIRLLRSRWRVKGLLSRPFKNHPNVLNMKEWLAELGYHNPSTLHVIHITGTKGKGSTASCVDSLIRANYRRRSGHVTVGLYTSPHLITERERIRINSQPLSDIQFARYFFEVWDTLFRRVTDVEQMPGYLQLLCLLSVHVFKSMGVDVAIYEVHAGGRKDATNIFDDPIATGFTVIGLDHADLLGDTIQSVTWHKSGIMKPRAPAFSVIQQEPAAEGLRNEARAVGCPLEFVGVDEVLRSHSRIPLRQQQENSSLAIKLANVFLNRHDTRLSLSDINDGVACCDWPGRFQRLQQGTHQWFLDSAHNSLSLPVALEWFKVETLASSLTGKRVLIFGHESARDIRALIGTVVKFEQEHGLTIDTVILSSYARYGNTLMGPSVLEANARFWREQQPHVRVFGSSSVEDAISMIHNNFPCSCQILVTGSTFLVGDALTILQPLGK